MSTNKNSIAETYRILGYNFESLADFAHMQTRTLLEMEQRLRLIEAMDGKLCMCSAMVNNQEREGNTVPFLYCVIKEGEKALYCPCVFKKGKESVNVELQSYIDKALQLHNELKKDEL